MTSHSKTRTYVTKWTFADHELKRAEACARRTLMKTSEYIRYSVISSVRNIDEWEGVFVPAVDRQNSKEFATILDDDERKMVSDVAEHRNVSIRNLVAYILSVRMDEDELHDGPRPMRHRVKPSECSSVDLEDVDRSIVNVDFTREEYGRLMQQARLEGRVKSNMARRAALCVAKGEIDEYPLRGTDDPLDETVRVALNAYDDFIVKRAARLHGRKVKGYFRWAALQYLASAKVHSLTNTGT